MTSAADDARPAAADGPATTAFPTAAVSPAPSPDATPHTGPPLRASDADRTATVLLLQEGVASGCLTPGEGSDRMAAAFAAVHRRELAPLVADLPMAAAVVTGAGDGRRLGDELRERWSAVHAPWRTALVVALLLVLTLMVGSVAAHLMFDGGPGFGGDRGFRFGAGPGGLTPR